MNVHYIEQPDDDDDFQPVLLQDINVHIPYILLFIYCLFFLLYFLMLYTYIHIIGNVYLCICIYVTQKGKIFIDFTFIINVI